MHESTEQNVICTVESVEETSNELERQGYKISAIERPAKTTNSTRAYVLLVLVNIFFGASQSLHGLLFPMLAEQKGLQPTYYGLVFGAYHLMLFIFTPLMGIWVRRLHPNMVIFCGAFTVGGCVILFGTLDKCNGVEFISLAFSIRIVEGFGAASLRASAYAIAASQFSSHIWTKFTKLEISLVAGLAIGPVAGGALFDVGGFSLPFYCLGGLTVIIAIVAVAVLPDTDLMSSGGIKELCNMLKQKNNLFYLAVISVTYCYTGYLQTSLEPHLRQLHFRTVFVGTIFLIPDAVYCLTAAGSAWVVRKGLNPVMTIFLVCLIMIPSLLLIGPASFINLQTSLALVVPALVIKGLVQTKKIICSLYGAYTDMVSKGHPHDVTTHSLTFEIYAMGASLGSFAGCCSAGGLYDTIGFKDGTLVLLGLEFALMPLVLTYAFLRVYRRPLQYSTVEENQPILSAQR